ncbi:MAG TPA: hypothetical protein VFP08_12980 [Acidimicrobiales bacterium]|nr:hypothetical protein [Acidimicrobiales bacterium]
MFNHMSDHPARRRTVAVFCLLVGVALLATACGDDGRSSESAEAAPATAAPKAAASEAESDYCRNALEWQVHELVPFDESDPAATEEYFGDFVAFVDEATASAPGELADGWTLVSDTVHTVLVPILERYDYDFGRAHAEATPEEAALLTEPPPEVAAAQEHNKAYEALACGVGQPLAAESESFTGPADSAYCDASRVLAGVVEEVQSSSAQPADVESLLTSDDAIDALTSGAEAAPAEIADDVTAVTAFTLDRKLPLLEEWSFDFRSFLLEASLEERAVFYYSDPSIRDQFARVLAYDQQVCGYEPTA